MSQTTTIPDAPPVEGESVVPAEGAAVVPAEGTPPAEGAQETKPAPRRRSTVVVTAIRSKNIDTDCWRGTAVLADLTAISDADVFDQVGNPAGLQRDLSNKHAVDAYNYVFKPADPEYPRAYPEVMLNVRDEAVVKAEPLNTGKQKRIDAVTFTFDLDKIDKKAAEGLVAVSRMDGNHRLFYGEGDDRRAPLTATVPFQLHLGLSPAQEANLFVDVNANQKGLNSSHLHVLRSRLTPEEVELLNHPQRVFARRLAEDKESPWYSLIYLGGSKKGSRAAKIDRPVSFVTLESGVRRTLSKSQYLHDFTDSNAQYIVLRNFWQAVKEVFAGEWADPKSYLVLKNIGVLSFSIFGATVIDRALSRGLLGPEDMKAYVQQVHGTFDWQKDATGERGIAGMSGNRAALLIAAELANGIVDPGESPLTASIQERLLAAAASVTPPAESEPSHEHPNMGALAVVGTSSEGS